jgi:hypothetical protein
MCMGMGARGGVTGAHNNADAWVQGGGEQGLKTMHGHGCGGGGGGRGTGTEDSVKQS